MKQIPDFSNTETLLSFISGCFSILAWITLEICLLASGWWWQWKLVLSVVITFIATLIVVACFGCLKMKDYK